MFLPKIGWVRYRKSRKTAGIPKNITISLSADHCYASIQTEESMPEPMHSSIAMLGIDMGIAKFATFSNGQSVEPINSFRKHEKKLAGLQRKLSKRTKFSANWQKLKKRIQKLHRKIVDIRNDFLHKLTTATCKNHAVVVIEDLKVRNMSKTASGNLENPGNNVKAKTGLNKSILDQGWSEFRRQLEYKLRWLGGKLLAIPPQFTSQTCSKRGYIHKNSRPSQAKFRCLKCGLEINADHNAAMNILAVGQTVLACGAERARASAAKQEPAYEAAFLACYS